MKHEGPGGGPYRELFVDPNAEALEKMKKQIEAEGKRGIVFLDDFETGKEIPEFTELLKKKIDPKDIVFYSPTRGVLRFNIFPGFPEGPGGDYYLYKNEYNLIDIKVIKKVAKIFQMTYTKLRER